MNFEILGRVLLSAALVSIIALFIHEFTYASLLVSNPTPVAGEVAAGLGAIATTIAFVGSVSGSALVSWTLSDT